MIRRLHAAHQDRSLTVASNARIRKGVCGAEMIRFRPPPEQPAMHPLGPARTMLGFVHSTLQELAACRPLDVGPVTLYTNWVELDRFPPPKEARGSKGKTVQSRCGAAAVIGQAPEPRGPLRNALAEPTVGRSFGNHHEPRARRPACRVAVRMLRSGYPAGMVVVLLSGPVPPRARRSLTSCPARQKGPFSCVFPHCASVVSLSVSLSCW